MKRIPVQEDGKNVNPTITELLKQKTLGIYLYGIRNIHIVITTVRGDLLLFSAKSTIIDTCWMV